MRFVITGEWDRNTMLRIILLFFLVFVALFWVSNWAVLLTKMDLTPSSIAEYYRGDPEAEFGQPPRPWASLAEQSHFHLFAMGILVMTLTHLLLFLPVSTRVKGTLVVATFVSALSSEGSTWLVRAVHADFAWLKIGSFLLLQASLAGLLVALLVGVARPGRNAYGDTARPGRP
ncbi:MAG TPA: hypothetical protein VKA86_04950 [Candidatus Krumholzibacteria bacterium]|nr:hypothetical protein [Candidatus Krumholzibacteria bacterium]